MQGPRRLLGTVLLLLLTLLTPPVRACSLVSCIDSGIEIRRDVIILVKHDGKPLPGVKIEIKTNRDAVTFTGITGSDGKTTITKLSPGEYWLSAELLGISAAYHCFHVNQQPSRKAKRVMKYDWGDLAPTMRLVAGRLIDTQPGSGGTPLWNLTHRITAPIAGAQLRLQNAITNEVFTSLSAKDGSFRFDAVPDGSYVLHVQGGSSGRGYDPTDLLMKVESSGTRTAVVLSRQEPSGTNCGDASLRPSWR